jgi:molybdopterin-binding protein
MAVRGQGHADPGVWEVFAVGRGAGFVVLAEVTARAAGELCLADGGPVWATVQAPGGRLPA